MVITLSYIIVFVLSIILTIIIATLDSDKLQERHPPHSLHITRNFLTVFLLLTIVYLCYNNFPVTLTLLTFGTGIIFLIDLLFFARKRRNKGQKPGLITENARGFFPVLLFVWIIRSFLVQPYHVPTGSLEPTVMAGDFIAVNQFAYGLRFPIGNIKLVNIGEPKLGDLVLFYSPPNPQIVFVKRLVGRPGDHLQYKDKVLYVNGQEAKQTLVADDQDIEPGFEPQTVMRKTEDLSGIKHEIFVRPFGGEVGDFDIVVPPGMYFMMGDNRDNSDDSRSWGFVPENYLIGKTFRVLISWNANDHKIRWDRTGKSIH